MNSKTLYNLKGVSFSERESFNNAILLLSMVKSEYYYIVGFSRPKGIIEVAFDYESTLGGVVAENLILDFTAYDNSVLITAELKNIVFNNTEGIPFECDVSFKYKNGLIVYEKAFKRDELIPLSIDKINSILLSSKKDIIKFLDYGYSFIIKG